ncbi:MAG: glycosyltransferase [Sulfuricurvum sp.]|jgi:glycosyltransferase involved in cell wall biosynthesis|uniref:glycosyltransferase family 2 protein n=1 Tax=Sulfuricurvum sp. TaxID=2025608 RepID=UPI0025D9259A|nr:glycosyltransferase [Sulfuricurvum sp.]MCK9374074.1 glycosyltransferase [Sulfuricurvum sp.]
MNTTPNTALALTIPTYNRADFLDYSLTMHIPLARAHRILIYISDNGSTDGTKEVVEKHQQTYPFLHYYRNETNVGADKNFERALQYPTTEYIWLLGDTYHIPPEGLNTLMEILKNTAPYDAIVVDLLHRAADIPRQEYQNSNRLLSDLGWHMTCLSSLIYRSAMIPLARFERYQNTNFIQTGIIFEYISHREFRILWEKNISINELHPPLLQKTGWYHQPILFDIACIRWSNFVFSLPASYDLDVKLKTVMDHGQKSHLFSLGNLFLLRNSGVFTYKSYQQYRRFFPFTISYSRFTLLLIALSPRFAYPALKFVWRLLKGGR